MYKKILIAYDGSEFSDVAMKQGCELARLCGAQIELVGIVATTGYSAMAEGVGGIDIWGMERDALEAALGHAARKMSGQGLKAQTSLREGNPAHEIASHAKEEGADLVVVGHSDKGILARWFEGSVGAGLLRELPCNLLVATG
jgi:nucleotide-binding universal stress UspA family protein